MTTTTNAAIAAGASTPLATAEPVMLKRRIGSTEYVISIRCNPSARETVADKIMRLIEGEVCSLV